MTCNSNTNGSPNWSPDGESLIYVSYKNDPKNMDIYAIDLNKCSGECCDMSEKALTRITENADPDVYPAWGPTPKSLLLGE